MVLDSDKIISEEWSLKPTLKAVSMYCYNHKTRYTDYKEVDSTVRVVGTRKQVLDYLRNYL